MSDQNFQSFEGPIILFWTPNIIYELWSSKKYFFLHKLFHLPEDINEFKITFTKILRWLRHSFLQGLIALPFIRTLVETERGILHFLCTSTCQNTFNKIKKYWAIASPWHSSTRENSRKEQQGLPWTVKINFRKRYLKKRLLLSVRSPKERIMDHYNERWCGSLQMFVLAGSPAP